MEINNNTPISTWTDQQLCDYIVDEGLLTVEQLLSIAPTREQSLQLIHLLELDKE